MQKKQILGVTILSVLAVGNMYAMQPWMSPRYTQQHVHEAYHPLATSRTHAQPQDLTQSKDDKGNPHFHFDITERDTLAIAPLSNISSESLEAFRKKVAGYNSTFAPASLNYLSMMGPQHHAETHDNWSESGTMAFLSHAPVSSPYGARAQIIGTVSVTPLESVSDNIASLSFMTLPCCSNSSAFRNKLMVYAINYAQQQGFKQLGATINTSNRADIELLQRHGFVYAGVTTDNALTPLSPRRTINDNKAGALESIQIPVGESHFIRLLQPNAPSVVTTDNVKMNIPTSMTLANLPDKTDVLSDAGSEEEEENEADEQEGQEGQEEPTRQPERPSSVKPLMNPLNLGRLVNPDNNPAEAAQPAVPANQQDQQDEGRNRSDTVDSIIL